MPIEPLLRRAMPIAFSSTQERCIKCGMRNEVWMRTVSKTNEYVLLLTCPCGYQWTEPTLDAPPPDPDAIGNMMVRMAVDALKSSGGVVIQDVPEFVKFQKIPRLRRLAYITEKIDGTNAQVHVLEDGRVLAASRNRYITPEADNHGFAKWVEAHANLLYELLGPGRHYGEWWGQGINRGYGLTEKRFSLFNVERWNNIEQQSGGVIYCVPLLTMCDPFDTGVVDAIITVLKEDGSYAAPGFMRPEGVVVYHTAANAYFKQTIEGDEKPKGAAE